MMSDILAEVDAALRAERAEKFLKEHGKTLLAVIVLTIALTAAVSFYKHWEHQTAQKNTAALLTLLDDPSFPSGFDPAKLKFDGSQKSIAIMTAAGVLAEEGKTKEALALYKSLVSNRSSSKDLKQLAEILIARLEPETDHLMTLAKIAEDSSSPWRPLALLDSAVMFAQKNEYSSALKALDKIKDTENLPESLYAKAEALRRLYAQKQPLEKTN